MRPQTTQIPKDVSDRLRHRLQRVGVALVACDSAGGVQRVVCSPRGPLKAVVQAPLFNAALSREAGAVLHSASDHNHQPLPLWPGVWVMAVSAGRRVGETWIAVFADDQLIHSDVFRIICQVSHQSHAQVLSALSHELPSAHELPRLAATVTWLLEDDAEIQRRDNELTQVSTQLGDSYEEMSLLYRLSSSMTVDQPSSAFLEHACADLAEVDGLDWLALRLVDEHGRLGPLSGKSIYTGNGEPQPGISLSAVDALGKALIDRAVQRQSFDPAILDTRALRDEGIAAADLVRDEQLMAVWLQHDNHLLGVMFGGGKSDGDSLSSLDTHLCDSLANSLAIYLENLCLYEDMQAMFLGTLHALTNSIDAKDAYTHGHSERVATVSRQLAEKAGLSANDCERIYIAGLVHDIGKIGVPEAVLTKPGRLSDEEFALIKKHPEIGARILEDIPQMQDLIPGVLYHHERWDGRGYPHGLCAEQIPLYGRVIGLADAFDAMSSTRTYRQALPMDRVLDEVRENAGTQFDPELALAFLELDLTDYYSMVSQHQQEQTQDNSGDAEAHVRRSA